MTRVAKTVKKKYLDATGFTGGKSLIPKKSERRGSPQGTTISAKDDVLGEEAKIKASLKNMRGEKRRLARVRLRELEKTCFNCRERGHSVKNCPQAKADQGIGICYHCGSDDHTTKKCTGREKKFAFATCFICKQQGHITSQCKQNQNGLYPDGGGCKYCGSVYHYARDCRPDPLASSKTIGTIEAAQGGDDDDVHVTLQRIREDKERERQLVKQVMAKPKKKIVTI